MTQTTKERRETLYRWRKANPEKVAAIAKRSYEKHKGVNIPKANAKRTPDDWKRQRESRIRRRPERYLWDAAKSRCIKSGIPFTITEADVVIPEFCPVLGLRLGFDTLRGPNTPSLDRVIPALGYVPGNIRVISFRANMVKGDSSLEELKKLVTYIEEHNVQDRRN